MPKLSNLYAPLALVVVVAKTLPKPSNKLTFTPPTPISSASWIPSLFLSANTKSPIELGLNKPKSTVKLELLSESPSVVGSPKFVNVMAFD